MSEQTDRIVKWLKDDTHQGKKGFLSGIAEKVGGVLPDNSQDQKIGEAVDLLKEQNGVLEQVEEISRRVEQIESVCASVQKIEESDSLEIQEITQLKSSFEEIKSDIKALQDMIRAEDISGLKAGLHANDADIFEIKSGIQANNADISELRQALAQNSKTVQDMQKTGAELAANVKGLQQNTVKPDAIAGLGEQLSSQQEEFEQIHAAEEELHDRIKALQEVIKKEDIAYIKEKLISMNKEMQESFSGTKKMLEKEEDNSLADQFNQFNSRLSVLYVVNGASVIGILIMLGLLLLH